MRTVKGNYPNGDPFHITFPTSTKDVKVLFLMYGIHAWPIKIGGMYDILYPNTKENGGPKFHQTNLSALDNISLKEWLEIGRKNCPEQNLCQPYDDKSIGFFKWPNVKKAINSEIS